MRANCPYCTKENFPSDVRFNVVLAGRFKRKSDSKWVQRFCCLRCKKHFSLSTTSPQFGQNKRQVNVKLSRLLASGVSQRRAAKLLKVSRTTVVRKFLFLGLRAFQELDEFNSGKKQSSIVEFDDLETFEHSKCKPLSVTLALESQTRRILGFQVSQMPAKGRLVKKSIRKYGPRKDQRSLGRNLLFKSLRDLVHPEAIFKSDENPFYPRDLKRHFPLATHETFKGQRGSIVGQGELKKIRFDPLFSLNHTCAMLRANINRLIRKTWCTTKLPERLAIHLAIYAIYHNKFLIESS